MKFKIFGNKIATIDGPDTILEIIEFVKDQWDSGAFYVDVILDGNIEDDAPRPSGSIMRFVKKADTSTNIFWRPSPSKVSIGAGKRKAKILGKAMIKGKF